MRELAAAELETLRGPRPKAPSVAKFRDSHHMVARLFASGLRPGQVADRCGYSRGRIQMLHNDPAFQELIAQYRGMVDEEFRENVDDFVTQATSNMVKAERMLADRLDQADEEGELPPVRDLVNIVSDRADRFGYGKRQTNLNVNVDFAAKLDQAIARSTRVIDSSRSSASSGSSASEGQVLMGPALRPSSPETAPAIHRSQGSGARTYLPGTSEPRLRRRA